MTGPAASNLQPSDLRSDAYRSLPGGQDVFFLTQWMHVSTSVAT